MSTIVIYTDGGARNNPGPAGVGVVIIDGEKKHIKLANFAILGIEFTMVLFILALVWKSGVFA